MSAGKDFKKAGEGVCQRPPAGSPGAGSYSSPCSFIGHICTCPLFLHGAWRPPSCATHCLPLAQTPQGRCPVPAGGNQARQSLPTSGPLNLSFSIYKMGWSYSPPGPSESTMEKLQKAVLCPHFADHPGGQFLFPRVAAVSQGQSLSFIFPDSQPLCSLKLLLSSGLREPGPREVGAPGGTWVGTSRIDCSLGSPPTPRAAAGAPLIAVTDVAATSVICCVTQA